MLDARGVGALHATLQTGIRLNVSLKKIAIGVSGDICYDAYHSWVGKFILGRRRHRGQSLARQYCVDGFVNSVKGACDPLAGRHRWLPRNKRRNARVGLRRRPNSRRARGVARMLVVPPPVRRKVSLIWTRPNRLHRLGQPPGKPRISSSGSSPAMSFRV